MTSPPHTPLQQYYGREEDRGRFVRSLFDRTATDYDRVERLMALGSGSWYRRQALRRAGLERGMSVLDVAMGTGLVAREIAAIVGDPRLVLGLDPAAGMLGEARRQLSLLAVQGRAEAMPLRTARFDFLSMGFALRHVSDLEPTFAEFRRVLRPGGNLCILEITAPRSRASNLLLKAYMRGVVPVLARLVARHTETPMLMRYYWDTIEACVRPETVLEALRGAGFEGVERHVELGIFSEYRARRPRHDSRRERPKAAGGGAGE